MKKLASFAVAASLLAFGSVALAQGPLASHPHLQSAQQSIQAAIAQLKEARNGKAEFGGHRDRAEELLHQAVAQINQAAQYANSHKGKPAAPANP